MDPNPNPERGCGTKSTNACYGESPVSSPAGTLGSWTWLLGDGYKIFITVDIPPRKMIVCNPAATIVIQGLERDINPYFTVSTGEIYDDMLTRTRNIGIGDHVGSDYSAHSFAVETRDFGASRRMTRQTAAEIGRIIWNYGPIPILFSHNRVPVFENYKHVAEAFRIADACYENVDLAKYRAHPYWNQKPSWMDPSWTQYIDRKSENEKLLGTRHIMKYILFVVGCLDMHWRQYSKIEAYQNARDFFKDVRFVEQAIGLGWIGRVTMTADVTGEWDDDVLDMQQEFGKDIINTIDLSEVEETVG